MTTTGIVHKQQSAEALGALTRHVARLDPWSLTALHNLATITGSALIAAMLAEGALDREAAWRAAFVDEDWEAELWGQDEEALQRRAALRREFDACVDFLELARQKQWGKAMARDPRYDILFEPVKIGPVTREEPLLPGAALQRHGLSRPDRARRDARASRRRAAGPSSAPSRRRSTPPREITPFIELRLWDDQDMPMLARIADAIHEHGALAGIELCHNGMNGPNLYTREMPLGPGDLPIATFTNDPVQARAHGQGATSATSAAGTATRRCAPRRPASTSSMSMPRKLLRRCRCTSCRAATTSARDEYGGSLENRVAPAARADRGHEGGRRRHLRRRRAASRVDEMIGRGRASRRPRRAT